MTPIGLHHYLVVSTVLFTLGILCLLVRRNAINILMGVELVFNASNVNLVAFGRFGGQPLPGQLFTIFVVMIAAAEAAVALAIVLAIYKNFRTVNVDAPQTLKW